MIEIKRVDDKQFPIRVHLNSNIQKFTEAAARELMSKLKAVGVQSPPQNLPDVPLICSECGNKVKAVAHDTGDGWIMPVRQRDDDV